MPSKERLQALPYLRNRRACQKALGLIPIRVDSGAWSTKQAELILSVIKTALQQFDQEDGITGAITEQDVEAARQEGIELGRRLERREQMERQMRDSDL